MPVRKTLLLIILTIIFLSGCSVDKTFGIAREEFNCEFDTPPDDTVLQIADGLINNLLTVNYSMESMTYSLETLDWNVQYSDSPNSFQLYLQCLNPVMYLTKAYEITKNTEYLDQAECFIKSWADYLNTSESMENPFLWYDHGTALRVENLIYYSLVASENNKLDTEMEKIVVDLIAQHGEYLSNDANYTANHNHGIFQDRALIYTAYFLNNDKKDEWLSIAKERLEKQKAYAFSEDMVHVENSPGYQVGVMDLFRIISEFLLQFNDGFGEELYSDIKKSAEFLAYIIKPNGHIAEIGDTNGSKKSDAIENSRFSVYGNDHLTYAASLGRLGNMPEENSKIYSDSGYYVSHNNWNRENYTDSTWMMFKSGYSSQTHKHADDNSFMLYSKGYDIFVDPGYYNYVTGNKYRDYFTSSRAHNVVVVDEKRYSTTAENSYKTGIFDFSQNPEYDYVAGYNDMYEGVMYDRYFYNLGEAIIIFDNLISDNNHNYSQLFQLSDNCSVVDYNDREVLIKIADSGYYARVKQLVGDVTLNIIRGNTPDKSYGYISHYLNNVENTTTLKFDATGSNVDFITLITIENENGKVANIDDIQFDEAYYSFNIKKDNNSNINIQLSQRDRLDMSNFSIKKTADNRFQFTNHYEAEGTSYAWYIIEKNSAEVIYKSEFEKSNSFEYEFETEGEYLIKAYAKDRYGQRKQKTIGVVSYNTLQYKWVDNTENYPNLNLVYNGHSFKQLSERKFQFHVDFDYSLDSRILWYIYKDGAAYESFATQKEKNMEYEFIEPGNYTVIYYLKTANGDNQLWNFDEIKIS